MIAFGCDQIGGASDTQGNGTQDPLLIRFSTQEDATLWYPAATNTAGDLRLGDGSTFVQAVETKKRNTDLYRHCAVFYEIYRWRFYLWFATTCLEHHYYGAHAAASASEDVVFWMGIDNFYIYLAEPNNFPAQ